MDQAIHLCANHAQRQRPRGPLGGLGLISAQDALRFHQSFPQYHQTPLARLSGYAARTGVKDIFVKDESYRFGLSSFKVLGGSYAIGSLLADKLGNSLHALTFSDLTSESAHRRLGACTFVSATDGNHGRGIAWTATQLHQHSHILMPKGSSPMRLKHIQDAGAEASITDLNYDDAVREAARLAQENGWILVQDTAWPGYERIPRLIMQGYQTMSLETFQQLGTHRPTHIFIQAGVGSLAASVLEFFHDVYADCPPVMTVVEPDKADCIFRTAKANDGTLHSVKGDMNTIMAGLACGEPSTIAWDILKERADYFLSIPDYAAAQGMRILGNPLPGDPKVISGESGASSFGALTEILCNQSYGSVRKALGITRDSVLLFFSSEGDTDPDAYRKIVWDGLYPHP